MNRIVREHYPVSKLPEELRAGFDLDADVRVVVERVDDLAARQPSSRPIMEILEEARQMRADGRIKTITDEEAVARIRQLRDEWD